MNNNENTVRFEGRTGGTDSDNLWKKVTLGTTSGILLGAGAIQGVNYIKANQEDVNADSTERGTAEADVPVHEDAPVAHVSNSMSFDQAFAAARAEVGPGGVFAWHGGIYGTYYETEWDAMSDAQKTAYAQSVHPEVTPQHVQVNMMNEAHPDVVVDVRVTDAQGRQTHLSDDSHITAERPTADLAGARQPVDTEDDDVHIIGQGEINGHQAVALDMTGNDEADAVIIDVDDSLSLSDPDVVVFRGGMATTIGDMVEGNPPVSLVDEEYQAGLDDTPDVATDVPDVIDDGSVFM